MTSIMSSSIICFTVYVVCCPVLSDGTLAYSEIRTFVKKEPDVISMYKQITTSSNVTISLSADHLIYARKGSSEKFYSMYVF